MLISYLNTGAFEGLLRRRMQTSNGDRDSFEMRSGVTHLLSATNGECRSCGSNVYFFLSSSADLDCI